MAHSSARDGRTRGGGRGRAAGRQAMIHKHGEPEIEIRPLVAGNGKPVGSTSWDGSVTEAGSRMRSYYGRPVIKPPVWQPEIPVYFLSGGLAGASSLLSMGARL